MGSANVDINLNTAASESALAGKWLRHWYRSPILLVLAWICGLAWTVHWSVFLYRQSPPAFMDLDVYRLGVQAWWHGQDMYGPLPRTIAGIYLPFIYPPFAAAIFSPLAALPWTPSAITMLLLSMLSLAGVIYLTARRLWPEGGRRAALLCTGVALPLALHTQPVSDTLWFGQINLVLMALVTVDCLVPHPKWPRGVLVGIAAAIKLTPAVFVLYFLLRKDYKATVTTVVSAVVATGLGFLISPIGSVRYWFGSSGGARSISGSTFYTNQTIDAALARLPGLAHEQTLLWLAGVVVVGVFAVIGIRRAHLLDSPVSAPLAMVLTGAFGLIASPTSWGHHWVYEVPAIMVMLAVAIRQRKILWLIAAAGTALVFWYAPFMHESGHGPSLLARAWYQIYSNGYTSLGILLLILFAIPAVFRFRSREATTVPSTAPTVSTAAPTAEAPGTESKVRPA
ncbi:MAG TPA: glycosyltransferase 87 family protein [Pseudonocardiaceae bacterium]